MGSSLTCEQLSGLERSNATKETVEGWSTLSKRGKHAWECVGYVHTSKGMGEEARESAMEHPCARGASSWAKRTLDFSIFRDLRNGGGTTRFFGNLPFH